MEERIRAVAEFKSKQKDILGKLTFYAGKSVIANEPHVDTSREFVESIQIHIFPPVRKWNASKTTRNTSVRVLHLNLTLSEESPVVASKRLTLDSLEIEHVIRIYIKNRLFLYQAPI